MVPPDRFAMAGTMERGAISWPNTMLVETVCAGSCFGSRRRPTSWWPQPPLAGISIPGLPRRQRIPTHLHIRRRAVLVPGTVGDAALAGRAGGEGGLVQLDAETGAIGD